MCSSDLVISSANKQRHKALFYPGLGPRRVIPYVLLVWIDFDGVVTIAEITIAIALRAIAISPIVTTPSKSIQTSRTYGITLWGPEPG